MRADAGTCHHCRFAIPAHRSGVETAQVSRFRTVRVTLMAAQARPRTTAKRPHFNRFSEHSRRYMPPLAIVSVYRNFYATDEARGALADWPGDASRITTERAKSIQMWPTVSLTSIALPMNCRVSLRVRVCTLLLCSLLCCLALIRFRWCAVQVRAL